jgi:hypothetical protein
MVDVVDLCVVGVCEGAIDMRRHGSAVVATGVLLMSLVAIGPAGASSPTGTAATRASSDCPPSTSVVTVTCDEAAFLRGGGILVRQTFEVPRVFDPARKVVSFSGMKFVSWDRSRPYWSVDAIGTENGKLYRKFSDGSDTMNASVYFAGRGSVERFGFLLHPFGFPNQFVIRIIGADGSQTDLRLTRNTGDVYLGLSSSIGITKVKVLQYPWLAEGVSTNFGFDNVARGPITPPAS